MEDRIYIKDAGQMKSLTAQDFAKEKDLQALIADHPELLAWEQMSQDEAVRWILVRREQGIAQESGAGARWSVDHLFIDHDAVPTLVEVKRSANREIRREVVGQMLEYAAHASQTWTDLRETFRKTCEERKLDPDAELRELLGMGDEEPDADDWADQFWKSVNTNLAAKRLRLLFVADGIPDELTRIVEFLNATMQEVEVLAVEIKKYDGESGLQTLVPRVIGRTAKPAAGKGHKFDPESFLTAFKDDAVRNAVKRILDVAGRYDSISGKTGLSVRYPRSVGKWVSVAWVYPPNVGGVHGFKDFTFGRMPFGDSDPPELRQLLNEWCSSFSDDDFANEVPVKRKDKRGVAWQVTAKDTVQHIDTLADRLAKVLTNLRSLEAP